MRQAVPAQRRRDDARARLEADEARCRRRGCGSSRRRRRRSPPRRGPAATAAALPPLEPPGVRSRSHGLRVAPYQSVSVKAIVISSGTLVLPTMTAPSSRSRATISASSRGRPAVGDRALRGDLARDVLSSLIAIGTPSSGRSSLALRRASAWSASVSARSAKTMRKALRTGSCCGDAVEAQLRSARATRPAACGRARPGGRRRRRRRRRTSVREPTCGTSSKPSRAFAGPRRVHGRRAPRGAVAARRPAQARLRGVGGDGLGAPAVGVVARLARGARRRASRWSRRRCPAVARAARVLLALSLALGSPVAARGSSTGGRRSSSSSSRPGDGDQAVARRAHGRAALRRGVPRALAALAARRRPARGCVVALLLAVAVLGGAAGVGAEGGWDRGGAAGPDRGAARACGGRARLAAQRLVAGRFGRGRGGGRAGAARGADPAGAVAARPSACCSRRRRGVAAAASGRWLRSEKPAAADTVIVELGPCGSGDGRLDTRHPQLVAAARAAAASAARRPTRRRPPPALALRPHRRPGRRPAARPLRARHRRRGRRRGARRRLRLRARHRRRARRRAHEVRRDPSGTS